MLVVDDDEDALRLRCFLLEDFFGDLWLRGFLLEDFLGDLLGLRGFLLDDFFGDLLRLSFLEDFGGDWPGLRCFRLGCFGDCSGLRCLCFEDSSGVRGLLFRGESLGLRPFVPDPGGVPVSCLGTSAGLWNNFRAGTGEAGWDGANEVSARSSAAHA